MKATYYALLFAAAIQLGVHAAPIAVFTPDTIEVTSPISSLQHPQNVARPMVVVEKELNVERAGKAKRELAMLTALKKLLEFALDMRGKEGSKWDASIKSIQKAIGEYEEVERLQKVAADASAKHTELAAEAARLDEEAVRLCEEAASLGAESEKANAELDRLLALKAAQEAEEEAVDVETIRKVKREHEMVTTLKKLLAWELAKQAKEGSKWDSAIQDTLRAISEFEEVEKLQKIAADARAKADKLAAEAARLAAESEKAQAELDRLLALKAARDAEKKAAVEKASGETVGETEKDVIAEIDTAEEASEKASVEFADEEDVAAETEAAEEEPADETPATGGR